MSDELNQGITLDAADDKAPEEPKQVMFEEFDPPAEEQVSETATLQAKLEQYQQYVAGLEAKMRALEAAQSVGGQRQAQGGQTRPHLLERLGMDEDSQRAMRPLVDGILGELREEIGSLKQELYSERVGGERQRIQEGISNAVADISEEFGGAVPPGLDMRIVGIMQAKPGVSVAKAAAQARAEVQAWLHKAGMGRIKVMERNNAPAIPRGAGVPTFGGVKPAKNYGEANDQLSQAINALFDGGVRGG
jgi:hypothetical protein